MSMVLERETLSKKYRAKNQQLSPRRSDQRALQRQIIHTHCKCGHSSQSEAVYQHRKSLRQQTPVADPFPLRRQTQHNLNM